MRTMTEEIKDVVENVEVEQEIDYKAELEKAKAELELVRAKKDELYKETKSAKAQREEALKEAKRIEHEKALRDGEYEKLFKQRDDEYKKLEQQLQQDKQERRKDKIELTSAEIANDLAKGDANKAVLLRRFIADNVGSLADEMGNLEGDVIASIKRQFESDARYSPLLGGNLSTGGSAPGNARSAPQADKTIARAEFNAMSQEARRQFFSKGGKISD